MNIKNKLNMNTKYNINYIITFTLTHNLHQLTYINGDIALDRLVA